MTDHTKAEKTMMTNHKTGTREEWLAARLGLLKAEKELTRRSDELERRELDSLWARYQWLDRAPRGRNEVLIRGSGDLWAAVWYRRHDEYDSEEEAR
jgi:predicted dithiol-disulfide oxidoreductase (DUF899 family)